jgi:ubiquinone/menaquinone biosynthesis C-methylase UbiE
MRPEALDAEFGWYTERLAEAIVDLAPTDPIPPACRGTGNPALLSYLADGIQAKPGMTVLDLGVGLGGPAAWLSRERRCRVVGVDVMEPGLRGLKRLFPSVGGVTGEMHSLPFRPASFDAAWCLGVIEMVDNKARAFDEAARVLKLGGRLAIYDFVAVDDQEHVREFETEMKLVDLFERSAFRVVNHGELPHLAEIPEGWARSVLEVRNEVTKRHSGDARFQDADENLSHFIDLRTSGRIRECHFVLERSELEPTGE